MKRIRKFIRRLVDFQPLGFALLLGCSPLLDLRPELAITTFEAPPGASLMGYAPLKVVLDIRATPARATQQPWEICVVWGNDSPQTCDGGLFVNDYHSPGEYTITAMACYLRAPLNCSPSVTRIVTVLKQLGDSNTPDAVTNHVTVFFNVPKTVRGWKVYPQIVACNKVDLDKLFLILESDEEVFDTAEHNQFLAVRGDVEAQAGCHEIRMGTVSKFSQGTGYLKLKGETAAGPDATVFEIRKQITGI